MPRFAQIDMESPDPTDAINAFFWNMNKARALGFSPPFKWTIAEHFLRDDVSLVFYGPGGGTIVLRAEDVSLGADESWEVMLQIIRRITERRKAKDAGVETPEPPEHPPEEPARTLPIMPRQKGGLVRAAQKQTEGAGA